MLDKPIIALDFPNKEAAIDFLSELNSQSLFVKVGMELFYQEGASFIHWLKSQGHYIFLDLKLHDIPNTVYSAMKVLASLGVDLVNVHAAGGSKMMKAALRGLEEGTPKGKKRPALIAVTQLTSTSEQQMQEEQLIKCNLNESVLHYAKLAYMSGLDGVVCSAHEAGMIAEITSESFLRVTPGIRMTGDSSDDQIRIVTPDQARQIGSTHIVIGRSITKANNPKLAYEQAINLWERRN
nr:orotidine-5'-phosphate decarboxylase [Paenibacillus bovis]